MKNRVNLTHPHRNGVKSLFKVSYSNKLNPHKQKNQNGRSMVEMLGVLAIIGVLSIGGIVGYSMAMEKYRMNQMFRSISLIVQEVRSHFVGKGTVVGLGDRGEEGSLNEAIMKKYKGNYHKIWLDEDSGDGFSIGLDNMDKKTCIALGLYNWVPYRGTDVTTIPSKRVTYSADEVFYICNRSGETLSNFILFFDENGILDDVRLLML